MWIVALLIILAAIGGGAYYYTSSSSHLPFNITTVPYNYTGPTTLPTTTATYYNYTSTAYSQMLHTVATLGNWTNPDCGTYPYWPGSPNPEASTTSMPNNAVLTCRGGSVYANGTASIRMNLSTPWPLFFNDTYAYMVYRVSCVGQFVETPNGAVNATYAELHGGYVNGMPINITGNATNPSASVTPINVPNGNPVLSANCPIQTYNASNYSGPMISHKLHSGQKVAMAILVQIDFGWPLLNYFHGTPGDDNYSAMPGSKYVGYDYLYPSTYVYYYMVNATVQ